MSLNALWAMDTVTSAVADTSLSSLDEAVIVAVPSPTAVTSPVSFTVATVSSLEDQSMLPLVALAGTTVAVSCSLWPTFKDIVVSERVMSRDQYLVKCNVHCYGRRGIVPGIAVVDGILEGHDFRFSGRPVADELDTPIDDGRAAKTCRDDFGHIRDHQFFHRCIGVGIVAQNVDGNGLAYFQTYGIVDRYRRSVGGYRGIDRP